MKIYADHELHKRDTTHRYDQDTLAIALKWLRCEKGWDKKKAAASLDLKSATYRTLEGGTAYYYSQVTIDKILLGHRCVTLEDLYEKAQTASLKFQDHELFGLICESYREQQAPKLTQGNLATVLGLDYQNMNAYERGRSFRRPSHIMGDLQKLGFTSMPEFIAATNFDVNSKEAQTRRLLAQKKEIARTRGGRG